MGKHVLKVTPSLQRKLLDTANLLQIAANIITANDKLISKIMGKNDVAMNHIRNARRGQAIRMRYLAKHWKETYKRTEPPLSIFTPEL